MACLQVLLISPANGENEQYSSRYENSYNGDSGKERLQIEGTELRGVEEGTGSSNRYNRVIGDNSNNFNSYWARLNWGRPSSARAASSSWTEESQKRIQWRPTTAQVNHQPSTNYASPKTTSTIQKRSRNAPHSEGEEMAAVAAVQTAAASSAVVAYDPEVELIDSSKISADLANLRYMRMEEVKAEKEKDKEASGYY